MNIATETTTETASTHSHKLTGVDAAKFALAGKAIFTLVSVKSGTRFTYRVTAATDDAGRLTGVHFVSMKNGPEDHCWTYIGMIDVRGDFRATRGSKVSTDAASFKAFAWAWSKQLDHVSLEVWHEGRCGKCGRRLTVPASILSGFGPECASRFAAAS